MAGSGEHAQLQPVDVDQLAVGERVGVEAVRRVEGADRAALAGRELDCDLGVVEVVVGQQHQRDVAGLLVELVDVAVLDRARVDDDRPATHPAR